MIRVAELAGREGSLSTLTPELTVNQVLSQSPETMKILARHSINLCCGSGRTLKAVAAKRGIEAAWLIAELKAAITSDSKSGEWRVVSGERQYLTSDIPKVGPTLAGLDVRKLDALWPTFVLFNLGNTMRITLETLTDVTGFWAYTVMGVSGFLEVAALAYWGVDLWRAIPEARAILTYFGFTELAKPVVRNTVAQMTTLEQACRLRASQKMNFLRGPDLLRNRDPDPDGGVGGRDNEE